MEFPKEKNQTKFRIFPLRYFWILFFSIFLVVTFFPVHNASAQVASTTNNLTSGQKFKNFMQTGDTAKSNEDEGTCALTDLPRCFIVIMFKFAGLLLKLSIVVFGWIINTDNIKLILGNTAIYTSWVFVRDTLNMAFIMVLLFSAFCTIFQIEQYNYKKLLWKIVLMALLVNFSYPIARFIIDASNILMYTLIKSLLGTTTPGNSFTTIANGSGLGDLIQGGAVGSLNNWAFLASTVMLFMLAITFLAIGILLLIRLIALAILIIFSPIAFVGSIMPGVSSYASQWWDNFFKYSFFGPIMIFGVYIAVELMKAQNKLQDLGTNAQKIAGEQLGPTDANYFGQLAFCVIPIVLLWIVMGIAQKMSIVGASTVMGQAQKAMKWSGKKFSGFNAIKRQYDSYAGERKKRQAEKNKGNFGGGIGKTFNKWQDTAIGTIPVVGSAARKRVEETERRAVQEQREEWKKQGGADEAQLDAALGSRNSAKKKAAAMEMAEKNGFGDGTVIATDLARYQKAAAAVKGDRVNEKAFKDKVEEKHVRMIIENEISSKGISAAYKDNLQNMDADKLAKQKNLLNTTAFHDNFMYDKEFGLNADHKFVEETAKRMKNSDRLDWKTRGYTI